MYFGDFALGETFDIKFTTRQFTTGAPFLLAGSPVISAYPGNSTTELTAGITLTANFDSRAGLNNVRVVATSGNGYAAQTNYALVITTGTVDGVSVVGEVIGSFSIENRSALRPTTAGRTLDVSAGGEAGIDWANIGSPTTAQNLSGTNIDVDQVVASVSGAVGSVTGAVGSVTGNVGGNVTGSVGSIAANGIAATSIATGAITAAKFAAGAIDAAAIANAAIDAATFAADVDAEIRSYVGLAAADLDTQLAALPTAAENADAVWDEDATGHQTQGTFGQAIGDPVADTDTIWGLVNTNLNATVSSRASQTSVDDLPTNAELATALGTADDAVLAAIADLPTNAELATALGTADDAVLAAIAALNDISPAEVNAEVDAAIETYHLDHLLANTYDPAAKPGAADALLNEIIESNAGVSRFTAGALAQAPGGTAPSVSEIADAVWTEAIADHSGVAGSTAEQLAAAGAAGDPWATALPGAYGAGTAGKIVGDNLNATVSSRASQTSVDDLPTNAELATALGTADDAVLAAVADLPTNAELATALDAADDAVLAAIAALPSAAAIADSVWDEDATGHQTQGTFGQAIGDPGADTDTLFGLVNTNLNATVSSRASQASVDDLPTNAELATALGTADDAVLAAVAALNDLSQADIRTAVGLASANLDTQLADLPTNAELATALGTADDAVLAAIAALNNLSAAQVNAEMVDVLNVDTFAEPTGVPPATDSIVDKLGFVHMALRNRIDITGTKKQFYDDAGNVEWEKDLSDDGTTFTETEANAP